MVTACLLPGGSHCCTSAYYRVRSTGRAPRSPGTIGGPFGGQHTGRSPWARPTVRRRACRPPAQFGWLAHPLAVDSSCTGGHNHGKHRTVAGAGERKEDRRRCGNERKRRPEVGVPKVYEDLRKQRWCRALHVLPVERCILQYDTVNPGGRHPR